MLDSPSSGQSWGGAPYRAPLLRTEFTDLLVHHRIELAGIEAMSRSTGLSVAELEWVQTLPEQFPEAAAAERALDAEIDAMTQPVPPL